MQGPICCFARQDEVPSDLAWLGPVELRHLHTLQRDKRRREWLLGRWTAKQVLMGALDLGQIDRGKLSDLEIRSGHHGAPEAFWKDRSLPVALSLSHRADAGFSTIFTGGPVGCDLEWIEPRSRAFIEDYFSSRERALIDSAGERIQALFANGLWSAKESVLKVLGLGLRIDTRHLEVEISGAEPILRQDWSRFLVRYRAEARSFSGWWRCREGWILTVATAVECPMPAELLRPGEEG